MVETLQGVAETQGDVNRLKRVVFHHSWIDRTRAYLAKLARRHGWPPWRTDDTNNAGCRLIEPVQISDDLGPAAVAKRKRGTSARCGVPRHRSPRSRRVWRA